MARVDIGDVVRNPEELIRRAAAGETVVITEHDRPIAMLVPFREERP